VRLGWASSRRKARALIDAGRVTVNGRHLGKGGIIAAGDDVHVNRLPLTTALRPNPEIKIEVLYEDESVLVVDKPGLIPCHPLRESEIETVINGVIANHPEVAEAGDKPLEGGLVHRLDNGTSGALIVARTHDAFEAMRSAIRRGDIARRYLALCAGNFDGISEIATPIAHHPRNRRKMITMLPGTPFSVGARPAATVVQAVESFPGFSLIEAKPRTGRRHQLRVHLASIGHPLVGDGLYGGPEMVELAPGRFWLHLREVAFDSPSGGQIRIDAPLPADLNAVLGRLSSNQ